MTNPRTWRSDSGIHHGVLTIGHSSRRAFTLLEVLLVLCMLAAMAALAAPALEGPFANQRLVKGADLVRSHWARARIEAVESGCIRVFRCSPGSDRFRMESLNIDGTSAAADASGSIVLAEPIERTLPNGISFAGFSVDGAMATGGDEGWTQPILFYPDGTSSSAQVTLTSRFGRSIDVTLRGLTGVAIVGVAQASGGGP